MISPQIFSPALAKQPVLIAVHPHGVLALTMTSTFAEGAGLESKFFPQRDFRICTVDGAFFLPGAAEWGVTAGLVTNAKGTPVRPIVYLH